MLLALLSVGLLGAVAYNVIGGGGSGTTVVGTTGVLNGKIDNGDRFRDITYTDKIEIFHPDVKNNGFYYQESFASDRGNNGIPRQYAQLYPGSSEITQYTLREHLFL